MATAATQLLRYHWTMRNRVLHCLACLALVAAAPAQSTHGPQSAQWMQRTLHKFVHPPEIDSENGPWQPASCDQIYRDLTYVLVQLGARQGDIQMDERGCHVPAPLRSMDATFRALVPLDLNARAAPRQTVQAHWRTVAFKGNCAYLQYITRTVLPLFATRNTKAIPRAVCDTLGVGLYTQVLEEDR